MYGVLIPIFFFLSPRISRHFLQIGTNNCTARYRTLSGGLGDESPSPSPTPSSEYDDILLQKQLAAAHQHHHHQLQVGDHLLHQNGGSGGSSGIGSQSGQSGTLGTLGSGSNGSGGIGSGGSGGGGGGLGIGGGSGSTKNGVNNLKNLKAAKNRNNLSSSLAAAASHNKNLTISQQIALVHHVSSYNGGGFSFRHWFSFLSLFCKLHHLTYGTFLASLPRFMASFFLPSSVDLASLNSANASALTARFRLVRSAMA